MGPVISAPHRDKVRGYVDRGVSEGASLVLDGRGTTVADRPEGYFIGPTRVRRRSRRRWSSAARRSSGRSPPICPVASLDEAIRVMEPHPNANATSIFTSSGKAAREFSHKATASMVGVNIGVAAPMAYFPFGGARDSFFGDLKVHGRDAFEFYTDKKVTITRWF